MTTARSCLLRPAGLFALAVGLTASPAARADHIDARLNEVGPKVVESLHKHGYQNVGVLRFRVEQNGKPATFSAGAINGNMADRLENVVVMHNDADESKAVGVIHRAGDTAVKHRVAKWYDDSAERAKLFKVDDYPLAWGNQKVKADVFLTGVVKVPADMAKTTVVIEAFSAKAPMKMDKVAEFTTDTDRSTLL